MTRTPLSSPLLRLLAPLALLSVHAVAQAQGVAAPVPQNVMMLSASASTEVTMDLLAISFSTTREGTDAGAVQTQLKQALDGALAEARKVARPGQVDVRTGNFALMPRYGQKGTITGWQGSAQLLVEGRDMQAISQLAGRIQTLSIANVRQGLSREAREKAEADTTAQAIARFRERAQAQSQLFGFASYTVREVNVGVDGAPGPVPVMAMRAAPMAMAAEAPMPVEAGKTTVTSSVSGSVQMLK
ncbi:MAG: SIMPL domain-containing protein [Rubrivivax sp.]|nr:SIMPL domain-containing protein [Rubrivivax sp.]